MFCVKCGAENTETINGLCLDCFLNGRKLISMPHHVDLFRCANCEEFSIRDNWVKRTQDEAITQVALNTLAIIPEAKLVSVGTMIETQEDKTFVVHVQADLEIGGEMVTDESSVIVRLKNAVCKRCSRQLGSYYEAILQIRSGEKNLSDELRDEVVRWITASVESQSKTNRQLFITKVQQVPGGVDIYISSISLGKALTRELSDIYGAEIKESSSLVGVSSDGQEVYRVTFLIRMPAYHVGDIILYNERPYKLNSVGKTGGKAIDIATFRETSIKRSELMEVKIIAKASELPEVTVVSRSESEIQVLHPRNYSTLDVRIPKGADIGDTVKVVEIEEELFFVP